MSSYIALDLDFLNRAPTIARAARVDEDTVLGGMSRLWAYCFREKTDRLTALHLRGLFHTETDLSEPLCVFGALERTETGFRVRGADRYLRIQAGRSAGGKKAAAAGNLKRGSTAPPQLNPSIPPSSSPAGAQLDSSLSPTSEHRTPNTEHQKTTTSAPSKSDTMVDRFWQHAQRERVEIFGRVQERPPQPRQLSKWFNEATLELRGDTRRLQAAWSMYCHDPYWLDRGVPWAGFMAQWQKFVPPAQPVDPNDPTAWPLTEAAS